MTNVLCCNQRNLHARNYSGHLFVLILITATLFFTAGCASPEPQPFVLGEPVWSDGESADYRITNRDERVAGSALFRLSEGISQPEGEGWTLEREVEDIGVDERLTLEMQPAGLRPVYSKLVRSDSSGRQQVETTIEGSQADISLTNRAGSTVYERVNVPSDIRDERSLLVLIRALPLAEGYATKVNTFLPITGQVERVTISVRGSEQISVPAGTFESWVVEIEGQDRVTRTWIGKEAPHPLVKFIDGRSAATFELREFEP